MVLQGARLKCRAYKPNLKSTSINLRAPYRVSLTLLSCHSIIRQENEVIRPRNSYSVAQFPNHKCTPNLHISKWTAQKHLCFKIPLFLNFLFQLLLPVIFVGIFFFFSFLFFLNSQEQQDVNVDSRALFCLTWKTAFLCSTGKQHCNCRIKASPSLPEATTFAFIAVGKPSRSAEARKKKGLGSTEEGMNERMIEGRFTEDFLDNWDLRCNRKATKLFGKLYETQIEGLFCKFPFCYLLCLPSLLCSSVSSTHNQNT